jgi:hypothetical protein
MIARELRFGEERCLSRAEELAEETSKMLWALVQKL